MKYTLFIILIEVLAMVASTSGQYQEAVLVPQGAAAGVSVSGKGKYCCDKCNCDTSQPPKCKCLDIKTYCFDTCKLCPCSKSIIQRCTCADVIEKCPPPC
ncbi:hypothetical protein H6P81_011293 [Aristolochia fimbriata]|uniref:Bowman-Birk serine protease inhibitors family domain-containing protein n=1 Tax=Aristolochia fimbriata TaxID=158543 RepID=A0AAV7ER45_ARIFI|nr:hypothetical protein H6P81_011293 [Aristolochia fimbriata]